MSRAFCLAWLMSAGGIGGCRTAAPSANGASEGLKRLDLALSLHPYTREALYTLERLNANSPDPGSRVEPRAVLEAFAQMLRRHFKSVTVLERDREADPRRFHLDYNLDLHLEIGLRSGAKTEVHAAAHIRRPGGAKVDYINVDASRIVPYPASSYGVLEAVLEARDKTEKALLASPQLAAFARGRGPDARDGQNIRSPAAAPQEIVWVPIPGGSFLMGSQRPGESPPHQVRLTGFQITRTEVTFGQYQACVDAGACTRAHVSDGTCYQRAGGSWQHGDLPRSFQGSDQPVVCVDWHQARAFARWARGRLPSEAEWEYAARGAGRDQRYPWGDEEASCRRAVLFDGAEGCGRQSTWPVCSKPSGDTAQGLCDMAGNAFEWVQDRDHASYAEAPGDGSPWEDTGSDTRVRRGGSWATGPDGVRAAFRLRDHPDYRFASVGFRVVRTKAGAP